MKIILALFAIMVAASIAMLGLPMTLTGLCLAALGATLAIIANNAFAMRHDPNLHFWPSVTTCRCCSHRIFAWQRHERRPTPVVLGNPDRIATSVSVTSLYHRRCHGNPDPCTVSVRIG